MARLIVAMLAVLALAAPAAQAADAPAIEVLSNRADLISAGDALVAIDIGAADPASVRVAVGDRDVTDAFALRPNGRYEGLVEGLAVGENELTATVPAAPAAHITIVNHPNGGPVFSGPQVQPWVCQAGARDAQCNQPETYSYEYRSSVTGQFAAYDPGNPPADVAQTTTDEGVTAPFIVRTETGYQDRDQYKIAVLFDPAKPWTAWAPQRQFNHKLLITHGASCGIDHQSGEAPSVTSDTEGLGGSPTEALGRGFAVMSTALDNAGHNCNLVTEAESLVMAKERLVERYGELRYTIGTGCSGGSLVQQQVANAYPGIYQGILPQCSFPDSWSTGQQLADYHLVRGYVENPARWGTGVVWTPAEIAAVEGHPNHVNSIILDSLYFTALGDPTNPCAGVSESERYDPQTNPDGVRCTLADYMVNVMGRRADGFAGRPLDNVGVQYGLEALKKGQISPAQFADINARIGGADIDAQWQPERVEADRPALANTYRSGGINETNNLDQVAIIDLRGTDPGAFHDVYRAFAIRARLERERGSYANQVIWEGPVPLIGQTDYTVLGLRAMDRWLSAVEKDTRDVPLARKIVEDKPADIHDQCTDGLGHAIPSQEVCSLINPIFTTPRVVAGEGIETDVNKCSLKPLRRSDYLPIVFTDAQWAQVRAAFPGGICNWSRPGVDQQATIPWMTYEDTVGGRPLGAPPESSSG
jgi:Tannase-like family of unknown function (DUF6351)